MSTNQQIVDVFPIAATAFGLRADWLSVYSPKLIPPAYLLIVLLLIISIGIMVLKRFENVDLEKKLWNIPFVIIAVAVWPFIIFGLKDLVDTFNTFLVREVFQIRWQEFGFPELGSATNIFGWSAEGLARLLPNLSYWIIYAFHIIFFFFFAVLGPLILAKGILFDEVEAFIELLREVTNLLLWQTTIVILVAFIMPDIVSGNPFPPNPQANFYFLSLILGIMMFFAPSLTRKFTSYLSGSFFPPGSVWMAGMIGIKSAGRLSSNIFTLGLTGSQTKLKWPKWSEKFITAELHNYDHRRGEEQKSKGLKNLSQKFIQSEKQKSKSIAHNNATDLKTDRSELKTPKSHSKGSLGSMPPEDSTLPKSKQNEFNYTKKFSDSFKGKSSRFVDLLKKAKAEISENKSTEDKE